VQHHLRFLLRSPCAPDSLDWYWPDSSQQRHSRRKADMSRRGPECITPWAYPRVSSILTVNNPRVCILTRQAQLIVMVNISQETLGWEREGPEQQTLEELLGDRDVGLVFHILSFDLLVGHIVRSEIWWTRLQILYRRYRSIRTRGRPKSAGFKYIWIGGMGTSSRGYVDANVNPGEIYAQ